MEWLTLIVTLVVGVFGIHYFFFRKLNKLEKLGILHTKPWPILGHLAPTVFRRCSLMETVDRIYRNYPDADYVGFYNMAEPVVLIRSPELMKSIAIKNFDHFVDHRTFVDPDLDPLFGNNLIALRGEKWKGVRNLLSPAFTSSKMKGMFHLMAKCGKNFVDHFANLSADELNVLNTKDAFTRYTNDVIATCAFGISIDSMKNPKNEFYIMGRDAVNFDGLRSVKLFALGSFPKISKFLKLRFNDPSVEKFFTTVVKDTIETRDREGITRPDMIQLMMETRGNKPGEGPELTIQEMVAQAFVFFFGGFESTSTTMCFAAYEIAVNEDVQRKLQEEVDDVMEKNNGEPTYEALNEMQYLDAVINETLRLYPVGPFLDRLCVKTFELPPALPGGKPVTIEPGQNVWLPAYCIHRDPKYFPNPTKFDPDRFMGSRKKDIDTSTFFPFGLGPRMCIGNRFALLEVKVVLFYLLSRCNLKPSSKTRVPIEFSKQTFAVFAEGGFFLRLEPRSNVAGKVM